MDFLHKHIEALIFCSPSPLGIEEIQKCLTEMFESEVAKDHILQAVGSLQEKYEGEDYSFSLNQLGGGYQFLTKPAYQVSVSILLKHQSHKRLSTAQLETLSIIAYKQPVTKTEVEHIRGVSCDYSIQKLLEKELVLIKGKSDSVGRPILYGTSEKFMEYFGINNLTDLPQPKDFTGEQNQIGEEKE
ncbi:SMC-Scp complex subunit ScpB [Aquiflexum lacus]|uniref:SMC-Scp complex subunit ScpB n=1 Tax=Aquiflexum lacus TaxID=2483805 RepID=UPI0018947724|nr:SMC-Scp complex subunit ScpB [Aquiflexum lacus]